MGDPRKQRKKYQGPRHPWQETRLKEEASLVKEFGLKNKKEVHKAVSEVKRLSSYAKRLIRSVNPEQAKRETEQFLTRLKKDGILKADGVLGDVLALSPREILSRRLQSVVHKKGYSLTPKQARQFIVHGHVCVDGQRVSVPSYVVSLEAEEKVSFFEQSSLADEEHPERAKETQVSKELEEAKKQSIVEKEEVKKPVAKSEAKKK